LSKFGYTKDKVTVLETVLNVQPADRVPMSNITNTRLPANRTMASPVEKTPLSNQMQIDAPIENILQMQKQTVTKDGRKRITPVFVGSSSNVNGFGGVRISVFIFRISLRLRQPENLE
jgi:hypothetical protein